MKTKIYTLIAITLMIASAFVGIGAMASSNDADPTYAPDVGTGTINHSSTVVDYVPEFINVTTNGTEKTASFSPTVNWSDASAGYKITSTAKIYTVYNTSTGKCNTEYASGTGAPLEITVHNYDSTTDTTLTIDITGNTVSISVLYIVVTSTILKQNLETTQYTEIASRSTDPMKFTVNVYGAVAFNTNTPDSCYFGEEYNYSLNDLVSGGSEEYAFVVTGHLDEGNLVNTLDGTGLYILGNSILGTAVSSAFDSDLSVDLKVTDLKTGLTSSKLVTIPMIPTQMTVTITETDSSVGDHTPKTLTNGSTGYVDQNSVTKIIMTWTNVAPDTTTHEPVTDVELTNVRTGSTTTGIVSGADYVLNTALIGTDEYIINYTINGYSASFTFNLEVIADGSAFVIVPDISVTLTR